MTTVTATTMSSPQTVTAIDLGPPLPLQEVTNAGETVARAPSDSKWIMTAVAEDKSLFLQVDQKPIIETTPLAVNAEQKQKEKEQPLTPPLSTSPSSSSAPEGRWCRRCGVTETGRWRGGPLGKGTLCNACGLNWKQKRYPTEGFDNTTYPPPPFERNKRRGTTTTTTTTIRHRPAKRANVNSRVKSRQCGGSKSRRKTEDEHQQQQAEAAVYSLPSPSSQHDQLQDTHNMPEIPQDTNLPVLLAERKRYLAAGMYSTFYKELKPKKTTKKQTIQFKLPLPIHQGELLLITEKNFELPSYILQEHELGVIKPIFVQVRENSFPGQKRRTHRQEAATCQCKPPLEGQVGCGDDCLNRMLFYECDSSTCICGEHCSNRRFQTKAYVEELEPFQTMHRGWGLRTLINIKRGELITEYCGEVISTDMCNKRMETIYKNKKNFYFLEYAHGQVIDAGVKGSVARFINHSCDPNCHIEKWTFKHQLYVGVFASRDIPAGEELFYDYNFATFGEGQDQMCFCGSQKCRGTIGKKPPQKQV